MTSSSDDRDQSPYTRFSGQAWGALRADTPLMLSATDLERLSGVNEHVSIDELQQIYLPLSRLLNLHVAAAQRLHAVTSTFTGSSAPKVPFIIGLAGSVAVGKSTTARILQALLAHWPDHPKVDLVTTDGFLYPNRILEQRGIMQRKGFPESYDLTQLVRFLSNIKAGRRNVRAPIYSHQRYDVDTHAFVEVDQPDVVIVEGLNVLQPPGAESTDPNVVSDFFDFTIYVDAQESTIRQWFLQRFSVLRATAFRDEASYFHRYASMSDDEALTFATNVWNTINRVNLEDNILPTRERAHVILEKAADHSVCAVKLRRL